MNRKRHRLPAVMALLVGGAWLLEAPVAAQDGGDRPDRVEFSFDDAPLTDLVQYVARETGRRFIVPQNARTVRVTVISGAPVSRAELYRGFLSILGMHGMTVIRSGAYHRIVPTEGIAGRPTEVITDREARRLPTDDRVVTYLRHLEAGSLDEAVALLSRFSSPGGSITSHESTRTLILTDTTSNIERMLAILRGVQAPDVEPTIFIERVQHADAEQLAQTLRSALPDDSNVAVVAAD